MTPQRQVLFAVAALTFAIAGGSPASAATEGASEGAAQAAEKGGPTLVLGAWVGVEDLFPAYGFPLAAGATVGVRPDAHFAVVLDAYGTLITPMGNWSVLPGIQISPAVRSTGRVDLDLHAGIGRHLIDFYIPENPAAPSSLRGIFRHEGVAVGYGVPGAGFGASWRLDLQLERHTPPAGDRETRIHSHLWEAGLVWEAVPAAGHIFRWSLSSGIAYLTPDHSSPELVVSTRFTWLLDNRKAGGNG